jgi:predicted phage baseplate assembly protein
MPLENEIPKLDTRDFERLKREALQRIPRYTPEWTDFNESDPGVTLVELFAWFTETMLYEMNRVPTLYYARFLQMLGLRLRPARPATAYLTFAARPNAIGSVPRGTSIGAQPPGAEEQLIFETSAGLDLIRLPLTDVQVFDGAAFTVVSSANEAGGASFRPFGWVPQPGNALYLGFSPANPPALEPIFPQLMRWRAFRPLDLQAGEPESCATVRQAPAPPVRLSWEFRPAATPDRWQRLEVAADDSVAFTREGEIRVQGPGPVALRVEGRVPEPRHWLRVRLVSGSYPVGQPPVLDFLRPNVVAAENLSTVRNETLGVSDGLPSQSFTTRRRPIQLESFQLTVAEEEGQPVAWQRVNDFLGSGRDSTHYTLDPGAGEVRFGDGLKGLIPTPNALITATFYSYGGGTAGNVAAGQINALQTNLPMVESVSNERPAEGGRDEQSLDDFLQSGPTQLRHRNRAITGKDFVELAREVGGVLRSLALPEAHPDFPGVKVPGAVTVIVVPDDAASPPEPNQALLDEVCRHLEGGRLLTTEMYVRPPRYFPVTVEARVAAQPYAAFDEVRRLVIERLNRALDPRHREFGLDLYPTSLFQEIQGAPDVVAVLNMAVNGREGVALNDPIEVPSDGLVYGGEHIITVEPYREEESQT